VEREEAPASAVRSRLPRARDAAVALEPDQRDGQPARGDDRRRSSVDASSTSSTSYGGVSTCANTLASMSFRNGARLNVGITTEITGASSAVKPAIGAIPYRTV
jgi:hypothetical protein